MAARADESFVWILGDEEPLSRIGERPNPLAGLHPPDGLANLKMPASPMCTQDDTVTIAAAWKVWLEASYAPSTVRTYWGTLWRFLSHTPKPLHQMDADDVAAFLASFPYRSASRRTYYQALRSFFGYCAARGIRTDPTTGIRVPAVVEKVPRALSSDDVWRLAVAAHAAAPIRGWFVLFLYYTAARLMEAQNVRFSDIENGEVRFRVAKGGRERTVPVGAGLGVVLAQIRFLQPGDYLFPRSQQTLWKWCRDAGRLAGLERVHPHLLRSTAATRMLVQGARPHAVRQMLGHQSIRTTQRYWAVERGDVERAAAML